jgi:hypothetical protein
MIALAIASTVPVRSSAPDRMNIAAIVIGASFEKTENMPFESRMPRNRNVHAPMIATTVAGKRSRTNPTSIAARMTRPIAA